MDGENNSSNQPIESLPTPQSEVPKAVDTVKTSEVELTTPSSYERLALSVLNSIKDPDVRGSIAVAQLARLAKLGPTTLDQVKGSSYQAVYDRMSRLAKNMGVDIAVKNPDPLEGLIEIMAKSPDDETSFALGMMTLSKQYRRIEDLDKQLKAEPSTPGEQIQKLATLEDSSQIHGVINTGRDSVTNLILHANETLDVENRFAFGIMATSKSARAMNADPQNFTERHTAIREGLISHLPAVDDGEKYREVFQQFVPATVSPVASSTV